LIGSSVGEVHFKCKNFDIREKMCEKGDERYISSVKKTKKLRKNIRGALQV
jgi:hypothetical protein